MFATFKRMRDRRSLVRDIFREYMKVTREFWKIAERRAIYGSPNNQSLLKAAFGLQVLLIDRQALRFDHLITNSSFDVAAWKTLTDITDRLDSGWSGSDENSLVLTMPRYAELSKETDRLRASLDADILNECIKTLENDSKYRSARQAIATKVQQLRNRLSS